MTDRTDNMVEQIFSRAAWRVYRRAARYLRVCRGVFIVALLATLIFAATQVALGALAYLYVERYVENVFMDRLASLLDLDALIGPLLGWYLTRAAAAWMAAFGAHAAGVRVMDALRLDGDRQALYLCVSERSRFSESRLVMRLGGGVARASRAVTVYTLVAVREIVTMAGAAAVLLWLSVPLAFMLILAVPAVFVLVAEITRRARHASAGAYEAPAHARGPSLRMQALSLAAVELLCGAAILVPCVLARLDSEQNRFMVSQAVGVATSVLVLIASLRRLRLTATPLLEGLIAAGRVFEIFDEVTELDRRSLLQESDAVSEKP